MMIQIINPNTSTEMTRHIGDSARQVAAAGTEIRAVCPQHGPKSIECAFDETIAGAALLDVIRQGEADRVDAHIIACFGDPALAAARELADAPVIGIAEAAFHMATLISARFGIVTTLSRTLPVSEHLLHQYGCAHVCAGIRATDIPVLDLEQIDSESYQRLYRECQLSVEEDGAGAIVLGCAGMSNLVAQLSAALPVPVIDGVAAVVKLAESLNQLGLKTAKTGKYGQPLSKPFTYCYQHWSR